MQENTIKDGFTAEKCNFQGVPGYMVKFEIVEKWVNISSALVLYFDNNRPIPIRSHRFDEYMEILK